MNRVWLLLCAGLAIGAVEHPGRSWVRPANDTPVIVYASVTGGDAMTPVTGLSEARFEVWSDGRRASLVSVAAASEPLALVVLLDTTWTTATTMAPFVWDGTRAPDGKPARTTGGRLPHRPADLFMPGLRDGLSPHLNAGTRVRVGSIGRHVRLSASFTGDRSALMAAARDVLNVPEGDRYGPTPIWDAIDIAVTALESEPGPRAIILVTAGMSTGNRLGLEAVTRRAALAGVTVYPIHERFAIVGLGFRLADKTSNPWAVLYNPFSGLPDGLLKDLARGTGGVYFTHGAAGRFYEDSNDGRYRPDPVTGRPGTLAKMFERALGYMRVRYMIRFEPPIRDGKEHKLEVRVKDAGLEVWAPSVYRAPAR